MAQSDQQAAEFSRLVPRDRLLQGESRHEIEASPRERQALAERFGLLALDRLRASLLLVPKGGASDARGLIEVTGHFEAELAQACVVTLEPLRSRLAGDVELLYSLAPRRRSEGETGEVVFSLDEADPPEPVGPEGIDLGEAVAQQLAVAIASYPRAPGAALEPSQWGGPEADVGAESGADTGPFAALQRLKRGG